MTREFSVTHLLTAAYEQLLHLLFALSPLVAIVYLYLFQDPSLRFENHVFHEAAIAVAIAESLFITYVTWRCYRASGERLLRWLTLGFLGFSLIYVPHGAFTVLAHHNPMLFLLYGPASRLVMNGCLLVGILSHGRAADPEAVRGRPGFWGGWIAGFVAIDVLVAGLAFSPVAGQPWLRLTLEWAALILALGGITLLLRHHGRLPLLLIYTLSLAFFAQSSFAFVLARPWSHLWWLAHAISASGFLLLSYGVVRAFHTTRSFATVYWQEEIMRQLEAANAELTRMACTDPLTGISNRRHFLERLQAEIARTRRTGQPLSVLAIDLDRFKTINDHFGHQAGDEVLKRAVAAMAAGLRTSDVIGRMGGEEFAVLLPETPLATAEDIAERIRQAIAALEIPVTDQLLRITASLGAAQWGRDGESSESLLATADRRLYQAKHSGRNRVSCGEDGPEKNTPPPAAARE